jgi:hypothetical protein
LWRVRSGICWVVVASLKIKTLFLFKRTNNYPTTTARKSLKTYYENTIACESGVVVAAKLRFSQLLWYVSRTPHQWRAY